MKIGYKHSPHFIYIPKRTCGTLFVVEPISMYTQTQTERKSPAGLGHMSCARAHQYWHVIAQLCTEMGIRKSEIEVSSERNEIEGNKYFKWNKQCTGTVDAN